MGLSPSDHSRKWKSWGSFALPRPPPLKNTQKTSLCTLLGSPASAEPSCLNNIHVFLSPDKYIQKQIATGRERERERGEERGKERLMLMLMPKHKGQQENVYSNIILHSSIWSYLITCPSMICALLIVFYLHNLEGSSYIVIWLERNKSPLLFMENNCRMWGLGVLIINSFFLIN